jgi:hypothetical protein
MKTRAEDPSGRDDQERPVSEPRIYRELRRLASELDGTNLGSRPQQIERYNRISTELWNLAQDSEALDLPGKFSSGLEKLTKMGCDRTHLIVHAILYAVAMDLKYRQESDHRRREQLLLSGQVLTKGELNRRRKVLEEAASIVETMFPAMEPSLSVCQQITNLTECFIDIPALLRDFCECVDILLGRSATRLRAVYDLENAHLVILVHHVRERRDGFIGIS